jgi:hypothetical protein
MGHLDEHAGSHSEIGHGSGTYAPTMSRRSRRSRNSIAARLCVVLFTATFGTSGLVGCTNHRRQAAPQPAHAVDTGTAPATVARATVHPTRAVLAAALPTAADLHWLPSGTSPDRDSDLTDRLTFVGCSAAPHPVASNQATATNIVFRRHINGNGERVAQITYYDVDSIHDAIQFMSGTRAFLRCPNQGAPVSVALLPLATPTACEDTLALRTRQPVSETIDAWCRVGNLVASIRLDPEGDVAPTDAQGVATIDAVGTHLDSLFA